MHYCELTPRTNRGIVHLEAVVILKDCKLLYNRDSKLINCINIESGESFEILPQYRYKLFEDSKNSCRSIYKFEIALTSQNNQLLKVKEDNSCDSGFSFKEGDVNVNEACVNYLNSSERDHRILSGFNKSQKGFKFLNLSFLDNLVWIEYILSCRDWIVLEDNLLSVDIDTFECIHKLTFRIGISIDSRLNYLDLKIDSISCTNEAELLKEADNLLIRCKNCGYEVESISNFNTISLPSDLYINSIGSIYCEECQDSLVSNSSVCENIKTLKNRNILYLSEDIITINRALSDGHKNNIFQAECKNSGKLGINGLEGSDVVCTQCKVVIGSRSVDSVSYSKNRVSSISTDFDVFWRRSDFVEAIEKLQFEESLKLSLRYNSEIIHIVKVTREPDTFIFVQNNPVLTSRILYKIEHTGSENSNNRNIGLCKCSQKVDNLYAGSYTQSNTNSETDSICTLYPSGERLDARVYNHIKSLILVFSRNRDIADYIPSLIPQI